MSHLLHTIRRKIRSGFYKTKYSVFKPQPHTALPDASLEKQHGDQLRSEISDLSKKAGSKHILSSGWDSFVHNLRESMTTKDLNSFLMWPEIRTSMFYYAPVQEWDYIKKSDLWKKNRETLHESSVGSPVPYFAYPTTSGNLVHHAYHAAKLMAFSGVSISSLKNIVEIGGGYGSMARLMYKLGFSGQYTIFDLPEFNALQKYFLSMLGLFDSKKIKLMPDTKTLAPYKDADLLIMTWSLSEMPVVLRNEIMPQIGNPRYILIAYQKGYEDIDNRDYFSQMKKKFPSHSWFEEEIEHMKGNFYLIGKRS